MSQPFDRMAVCPAPVTPDEKLKDWWVENPWLIAAKGKSLSGYERNRLFWNIGGKAFVELSGVSGTDSDGDGRSAVVADLNHDGREDLMVRQAGGGAFLMFENQMPGGNWLQVVLRGTKSNRRGIGARVVAHADGGRVVRELFPANSFASQGPGYLHFGLGKSMRVSRLEVRWPSGETQTLLDVPANQRIQITEGSGEWARLRGGQ